MVQRKAPDANTAASRMAMASFHQQESAERSGKRQMKHAAMAHTLPNYMKATTSSDAKKQHACVSSSEALKKKTKKKKKKNCRTVRIQPKKVSVRATCSSTLKSCKFPEFLELSHGGTEAEGASAVKVCPYKYCSLNGHLHGQADFPPLKIFLASRRERMKQRGASPLRKRDAGQAVAARTRSGLEISSLIEEIGLDLLLEQPAVEEEDDQNDACSDRSSDGIEYVSRDREDGEDKEKGSSLVEEDDSKKEIEDGNQFMAESIDFNLEEEEEEEDDDDELGLLFEQYEDNYGDRSTVVEPENTPKEHAVLDQEKGSSLAEEDGSKKEIEDGNRFMAESIDFNLEEEEEDDDELGLLFEQYEDNHGDRSTVESTKIDKSENTPKDHAVLDQERPATEEEARNEDAQIADSNDRRPNNDSLLNTPEESFPPRSAATDDHAPNARPIHIARKNSRDEESEERLKEFDPRPPNFLPEEPEPESEKVDLRHQMMDERKNAEEWMIDYALQRTVTKLGSARRQKVALLVEAFETVIPLPPWQACR